MKMMEKLAKENTISPAPEIRPQRTQIMTLKEVAKYLGVHGITVYRLIKETDIPVLKLRGQWRFKKDILDLWLTEKMNHRQKKIEKR